jgi:signal transduction histidine kinase
MIRRAICFVALAVAAFGAATALGAGVIESFEEVRKLSRDAAGEGAACRFAALIVHASQIHRGMYVVVNPNRQQEQGVVVFADGSQMFDEGDIVAIEGTTTIYSMHSAVKASKVEVLGRDVLPAARRAKYFNLRMGYYYARRVSIIGKIDSARRGADGVTTFMLSYEQNHARCCVDGYMHNRYIGKNVVVTGCAFNSYNADGTVHLPVVELGGLDDIKIENPDYTTPALVVLAVAFLVALAVLFAMYIRIRRERAANAAVAKERRRMARELHDTIEQHLATAKILLSGALDAKGLPESAREAVRTAAGVLAAAKVEVRDAVSGLQEEAPIDAREALLVLARGLDRSGTARVRTSLAAMPLGISGTKARDIVAIAREAITNAVKHGKAKNVAIVCDAEPERTGTPASPNPSRGKAGFVLRILNDGEPFDAEKALGPETGHFGLFGMYERARRSGLGLAFVKHGKWCGVRMIS